MANQYDLLAQIIQAQDPNAPQSPMDFTQGLPEQLIPMSPMNPLQMASRVPQSTVPQPAVNPQQILAPIQAAVGYKPTTIVDRLSNMSAQKKYDAIQSKGLEEQRAGIKTLENQYKAAQTESGGQNPWISAIYGLNDMFNKTNTLGAYTQAQEAQKKQLFDMADKIQKARLGVTDKEADFLKNQIASQKDEQLYKLALAKMNEKPEQILPGQRALDQKFGKDYADFAAQGGIEDVQAQMDKLRMAADKMEQLGTDVSGGKLENWIPGGSSDAVRSRLKAEGFAQQQMVQEAIQSTLKGTLGAQFTAKEGEQLLARKFDPRLSATENARRAREAADIIAKKVENMKAAGEYFNQSGGTLQGYRPRSLDVAPRLSPEQEARRQELLKKAGK